MTPMPQVRRVFRTLLVALLAFTFAGCDSLVADIPRIGYELADTFGQPPLVHRTGDNSLEVIFPEDLVEGEDADARAFTAWRIARESAAKISSPARVPAVIVAFREREQRRQQTDPLEERFTWRTESVLAGDSLAVRRERKGGETGLERR